MKVPIEDTTCGNNASSCAGDANEKAQVEAAIAAGEAAAQADFKAENEELKAQIEELQSKVKELQDEAEGAAEAEADEQTANERLARLQADWENYRRRIAKERIAERERACEGLVKNLLPVIDDMERAIAHADSDSEQSEGLVQFKEGVEAVRAKMLDVLAKEGVELIKADGMPFDPMCHRAVGKVEDKDMYDETVHDVYQNGYRMAGKVIREAMVTVSYGGEKRPQETEVEEATGTSAEEACENSQAKDSE